MVEIECLVREKPIKFPSYIDSDDYDGHIFCHECNLLLYIKLESSKVKKYKVVANQTISVKSDIIVKVAFQDQIILQNQKMIKGELERGEAPSINHPPLEKGD